jgi:hypothetical protein
MMTLIGAHFPAFLSQVARIGLHCAKTAMIHDNVETKEATMTSRSMIRKLRLVVIRMRATQIAALMSTVAET